MNNNITKVTRRFSDDTTRVSYLVVAETGEYRVTRINRPYFWTVSQLVEGSWVGVSHGDTKKECLEWIENEAYGRKQ